MMSMKLSRTAQRAAKVVRFSPGITRGDLADHLGISVTTVNPVVAQLIELSTIQEDEAAVTSGTVGRPRSGLVFRGLQDTLAIVSWSHGVLDIALASFSSRILWRRRTAAPGTPHRDEITAAVEELFAVAATDDALSAPVAIVLGLPAPYERGVGVAGNVPEELFEGSNTFSTWFPGDPLRILADRFEVPVVVQNDANLGALGETLHGVAAGENCVVYVKMSGNGIGSGITIGGRLFEGSHGFAGEIAHVRIDDASTIICVCGSRGCLEEKVGAAMLRPLFPTHGEDFTYAQLLGLVEAGAPGPIRILQDAGRTVGRALADMCTYLNPGMIVLDAGAAAASDIVLKGVTEQIEQSSPPFIRHRLQLRRSELVDDAALLGAVEVARTTSIGRPKVEPRHLQLARTSRAG